MDIDEDYVGREQALVKHNLLKSYLEVVLSIIGVSKQATRITYVDCFAGPWGPKGTDLKGTSIAISLEIIRGVREALRKLPNVPPIDFQAIYIEKSPGAYARLSEYLAAHTPQGIRSVALEGDYRTRMDEVMRICGGGFAFFFIDPKGWSEIRIEDLAPLLRRPRSEFLINLMYDFLNRALGMKAFREKVELVLGKLTDEESASLAHLETAARGRFVVEKYRASLENAMGGTGSNSPRSYNAAILKPQADRVLYHLVYLTRHPKGIVEFAKASEKAEYLQRVVRIQTKRNQTLQSGLFTAEEEASAAVHGGVSIQDVKSYWLAKMQSGNLVCDEACLADALRDTGWLVSDIQRAFSELIAEGLVENLDARGPRRSRPVHFDENERLRRVV
ncbi:three-Cys-motif partner protein TcmP [Solimonas sp. SE-A11]|uniref:three-Cys-motif partner protein TcmP n=1 Tax=Solimonas sp. SE-A11 TaxID=3054954 RepID=UPI00259CA7BA|nr:three-Cys-motif partner protein TcmP [Solimonas sp. SE-A11]